MPSQAGQVPPLDLLSWRSSGAPTPAFGTTSSLRSACPGNAYPLARVLLTPKGIRSVIKTDSMLLIPKWGSGHLDRAPRASYPRASCPGASCPGARLPAASRAQDGYRQFEFVLVEKIQTQHVCFSSNKWCMVRATAQPP